MEKTLNRLLMGLALVTIFIICMPLQGCSTLGNGKIDPGGHVLLDLTQINVNVQWISDDGRAFTITQTGNGLDIQAEFIEPKTGLKFILGEGIGTLTIRDPHTGLQATIKPKPSTL